MHRAAPPRRRPADLAGYLEALIEFDAEHGGVGRCLRSRGGFGETVADLKRQFRFIGDSDAYHFLWQVGEPVPDYDTWQATR